MPEKNHSILKQIKDARAEIEKATHKYHEGELEKLHEKIRVYRVQIADRESQHRQLDKEIDELQNQRNLLEAQVKSLEAKVSKKIT